MLCGNTFSTPRIRDTIFFSKKTDGQFIVRRSYKKLFSISTHVRYGSVMPNGEAGNPTAL